MNLETEVSVSDVQYAALISEHQCCDIKGKNVKFVSVYLRRLA